MYRYFENLLYRVLSQGEVRADRTGVGTISLFSPDGLLFDLSDGHVPLIESKRVAWKMATAELLWMLSGSHRTDALRAHSPKMADIWDLWADEHGDIGPTYGAQWRNAGGSLSNGSWGATANYGVDQLRKLIVDLATQPHTRRAVVSLWSVPELFDMGIEPCMVTFQFSLRGENYDKLHLAVYQRSADLMLGVPFDLYQAGLLAHLVARELSLTTGKKITAEVLTWHPGDTHVYLNQVDAAQKQLDQAANRGQTPLTARVSIDPSPALRLLDNTLQPEHVNVLDYDPAPAIDAGIPAA